MRRLRALRERGRLIGIACALFAAGAASAAYPERPIKVFLPFPPGGAVDFVSRLVCAEATEILGKPVVLDHRPGAGGTIATEATARSLPDGYSILITTPSHTINPALRPKLPFDTEADFVPVSLIANVPELLVAHPAVPFDTLDGMLKYAKANPGKLNYSSAGIGTLPHVTMELLLRRADVQVAHVAYKGARAGAHRPPRGRGAAEVRHLCDVGAAPRHRQAQGAGHGGPTRLTQLPNVPTVAESGFPGLSGLPLDRRRGAEQDARGGDHDAVRGVRKVGAHAEGRRTPARGGGRGRWQHTRGVRPAHRRRAQALVALVRDAKITASE